MAPGRRNGHARPVALCVGYLRLPVMADATGLLMAGKKDGCTALVAVDLADEARPFEPAAGLPGDPVPGPGEGQGAVREVPAMSAAVVLAS